MSLNTSEVRSRSESTASSPVTSVGPYALCYELGAGGMATVYLGHRDLEGVGRFAAVKVLHPHLANDRTFAEMFLDEAEIASRIRHLNVCTVYDFEMRAGASYIAMEYLLGHSMGAVYKRIVKQPPTSVLRNARLCAKVLADACQGLHAAHELADDDGEPLGVVHRDVSPGNLMLTFEGVAKVVDFGVAGAAHKKHRTETGVVKGKLAYIAPEVLRGRRADRRSDIWGIGVVAWELVTGKRLFHHPNEIDTLRAVMDAHIDPPSVVRPELPGELDEIIMRALARDRDQRYETARDLGRDLGRFANGDDVVTSADLAQWLDELFPGSRRRKQETLESALRALSTPGRTSGHLPILEPHPDETGLHHAQPRTPIPRAPETIPPPPSDAPPPISPPPHVARTDAEPTRLYPGATPTGTGAHALLRERPRLQLAGLVVAVLTTGALAGAAAATVVQGAPTIASSPMPVSTEPAASPPSGPAPLLGADGTHSYVVELVGTDGDAITLRLRPAPVAHASESTTMCSTEAAGLAAVAAP